MTKAKTKILIVDDEKPITDLLSASLQDEGFAVEVANNGQNGLEKARDWKPDVMLLDIWMPGDWDGLEVLKRLKEGYPEIQVLMMSGHGTIETAVKSTKLGAWDFVEKPLSIDKVVILIKNILRFKDESSEKMALLNKLRRRIALVGESEAMKNLKSMIARVAPSSSWVLINGENGTGKELVAQNIHYLSSRASQSFVEVNCAAIPTELIEAELFGYEKGAFTGADKTKRGKFELAANGTLFLDEIADMSLEAQAKVLRILQEKSFFRVGGQTPIEVDVRVIAATNKDLKKEIAEGRFREDLYYRLNVIPFRVPALRERKEDIVTLVAYFSDVFAREGGFRRKVFTETAMNRLLTYSWPGNVRELRNFIERIYILTPGDLVEEHDLRFAGLTFEADGNNHDDLPSFREARASFEKDYLLKKIAENHGNISKTAESIGLERSYLHRKIKAFGIDV